MPSLTRMEWKDMWETIKLIETMNTDMQPRQKALWIQMEIDKIKNKIQEVIGQME